MSYNSMDTKKLVLVVPDNTEALLDNFNPYISNYNNEYLLYSRIEIPHDLYLRAVKIENMNCGIRIVCLFDFFIGFYYFSYGYIYGLIVSCITINGYLSSIYYKKSLLCCYLIYQYFQVFIRLLNLILAIELYNSGQTSIYIRNLTNYSSNNTSYEVKIFLFDEPILNILILFVLLSTQMFISCFVREYYNLLPLYDDKKKN